MTSVVVSWRGYLCANWLADRKDIRLVTNLCNSVPKILYQNKQRTETKVNQPTKIHPENCH